MYAPWDYTVQQFACTEVALYTGVVHTKVFKVCVLNKKGKKRHDPINAGAVLGMYLSWK
jgi:hypothetical protein